MNVTGDGPNGESLPNFDGFKPFGSFNDTIQKQFARNETLCGVTVNKYLILCLGLDGIQNLEFQVSVPSSPDSAI